MECDTRCPEGHVTKRLTARLEGSTARYLSGFDCRDGRAVWSDWAHFLRVCTEGNTVANAFQVAANLHSMVDQSRGSKSGESITLPVSNLAMEVVPTSVP